MAGFDDGALELHQQAKLVSKSINPGHNSRVERTEASSTLTGGRHKKRALELHRHPMHEEDEDDEKFYWEKEEATFMAGANGAYNSLDMPKRIHLGYDVGMTSARKRALDASEERDVAIRCRHTSIFNAMMRDMYAKAAAKAGAAAAAPRT